MAASVLGKRHRRSIAAEEPSLPIPSRKRRARNSSPGILEEEVDLSNLSTHHHAPQPVDGTGLQNDKHRGLRPRIAGTLSSKRTVQKTQGQSSLDSAYPTTKPSSAVSDENTKPIEFKTPTAVRFQDALSIETPNTPKHCVKLICRPLTPRTPRTFPTPASKNLTVYSIARQLFNQSSSPGKLVGRDAEREQLRSFISKAIESKTGGCTYISGPPGTGKSALVEEVMEEFRANEAVNSTNVNCVSLKGAKDVFDKLAKDFCPTGSFVRKSDQALLGDIFVPKKRKSASMSYLVFLDEIDNLLDSDCEVLYSLFEWSLNRSSRLILIGIANALDLTDRFLPRLKARNLQPCLLPFLPYTGPQIASIITERLRSTLSLNSNAAKDFTPFVHPAAIQLSSKKVASQTGDVRKVFNLIRRAIDQVEKETIDKLATHSSSSPTKQPFADISNTATTLPTPPKSSPLKAASPTVTVMSLPVAGLTPEIAPRVTVAHIARLSSSIFNNGTASRLGGLNLQQKAVLCSLIAVEKRRSKRDPFSTPLKSSNKPPTVQALYSTYAELCNRDDGILHPLASTEFRDVVASLETLGLVHESKGRASIFSPTKTPSRLGRNLHADEKQLVSAVSEQEMKSSLTGPGGELLARLICG